MFSYVNAEQRIAGSSSAADSGDDGCALHEVSGEFDRLYAAGGRPSRAGETAASLAAAGIVRAAERAFADGRDELQPAVPLVRGLEMDDEVWDVTVFTKNRERLLGGEVAQKFLAAVIQQARRRGC